MYAMQMWIINTFLFQWVNFYGNGTKSLAIIIYKMYINVGIQLRCVLKIIDRRSHRSRSVNKHNSN